MSLQASFKLMNEQLVPKCERCRRAKKKCLAISPGSQQCQRCATLGHECVPRQHKSKDNTQREPHTDITPTLEVKPEDHTRDSAQETVLPKEDETRNKVLDSFGQFADAERTRLNEKKRVNAKQDRTVRTKDFLRFSETFKLKTPLPDDLVGILAKDPKKQEAIIQKAQRDHEDAEFVVIPSHSSFLATIKGPSLSKFDKSQIPIPIPVRRPRGPPEGLSDLTQKPPVTDTDTQPPSALSSLEVESSPKSVTVKFPSPPSPTFSRSRSPSPLSSASSSPSTVQQPLHASGGRPPSTPSSFLTSGRTSIQFGQLAPEVPSGPATLAPRNDRQSSGFALSDLQRASYSPPGSEIYMNPIKGVYGSQYMPPRPPLPSLLSTYSSPYYPSYSPSYIPSPSSMHFQLPEIKLRLMSILSVDNLERNISLRRQMDSSGFISLPYLAGYLGIPIMVDGHSSYPVVIQAAEECESLDVVSDYYGSRFVRPREHWQRFVLPIHERDSTSRLRGMSSSSLLYTPEHTPAVYPKPYYPDHTLRATPYLEYSERAPRHQLNNSNLPKTFNRSTSTNSAYPTPIRDYSQSRISHVPMNPSNNLFRLPQSHIRTVDEQHDTKIPSTLPYPQNVYGRTYLADNSIGIFGNIYNDVNPEKMEEIVAKVLRSASEQGILPKAPMKKDKDDVAQWVRQVIEAQMGATTIWDGESVNVPPSIGTSLAHLDPADLGQ